jgi:hypothetical protein
MKKFTNVFLFAFAIISMAVFFDACKKGPEDPFLSFRSRKARMIGEWTASKYFVNGVDQLIDVDYDSTAMTLPCAPAPTPAITYYTITTITRNNSYRYNFQRNGDFSYTFNYFDNYNVNRQIDTGKAAFNCKDDNYDSEDSNFVNTGTWEFGGGVGAARNKEQLVLIDPYNNFSTTWDIVMLKNKMIKLKRIFINSGNADQVEELTLIPFK